MWELYDRLLEPISPDLYVDEVIIGEFWTMVRTGESTGLAMTMKEHSQKRLMNQELVGLPLYTVASLVKSWNFAEAGVGLAAINSYYNTPKNLLKFKFESRNAFDANSCEVEGKKVAVIGHFRKLEKYITKASEINILERRPYEGDYPDSACEYILPDMDYVFITGTTLINKTLPRLLELSCRANIILLGPSVPLCQYFDFYGVKKLGVFVVNNSTQCKKQMRKGQPLNFLTCGTHYYITDIIL